MRRRSRPNTSGPVSARDEREGSRRCVSTSGRSRANRRPRHTSWRSIPRRVSGSSVSRPRACSTVQSLRSVLLAPTPRTGLVLLAIRVVDAPRFGYRGFMLDVARNFHPKPVVLRTLDLLARYKLNVFHLHLTDDEGWRIELPSLPALTAVGARRGHTLDSGTHLPPAFGSGPDVDRPWGSGFYSRADYVEILRYAAARHIEVIPEIEMPGHARAAIKSMEPTSSTRSTTPTTARSTTPP